MTVQSIHSFLSAVASAQNIQIAIYEWGLFCWVFYFQSVFWVMRVFPPRMKFHVS